MSSIYNSLRQRTVSFIFYLGTGGYGEIAFTVAASYCIIFVLISEI